jgi:hypothetical protein
LRGTLLLTRKIAACGDISKLLAPALYIKEPAFRSSTSCGHVDPSEDRGKRVVRVYSSNLPSGPAVRIPHGLSGGFRELGPDVLKTLLGATSRLS